MKKVIKYIFIKLLITIILNKKNEPKKVSFGGPSEQSPNKIRRG